MRTAKKIWLIIASCMIFIGIVISAFSLVKLDFDFTSLSTQKLQSNKHNISEDFNNIKIDVDTSDIEFVCSETQDCMVASVDTEKVKYDVSVQSDTLLISVEDTRKWYDHIGVFLGEKSLTIYLPKDNYDSLNIECHTSDITIPEDFTFKNLEIQTSTGDVELLSSVLETLDISTDTGKIEIGDADVLNMKCKNIKIESDTGDIKMRQTIATEKIFVQSDTGDVWFFVVEAPYIKVKTNTGDVKGDLYHIPLFKTKTDTGDVNVPPAKTDDVFEVTTDTGDIYFKVAK